MAKHPKSLKVDKVPTLADMMKSGDVMEMREPLLAKRDGDYVYLYSPKGFMYCWMDAEQAIAASHSLYQLGMGIRQEAQAKIMALIPPKSYSPTSGHNF